MSSTPLMSDNGSQPNTSTQPRGRGRTRGRGRANGSAHASRGGGGRGARRGGIHPQLTSAPALNAQATAFNPSASEAGSNTRGRGRPTAGTGTEGRRRGRGGRQQMRHSPTAVSTSTPAHRIDSVSDSRHAESDLMTKLKDTLTVQTHECMVCVDAIKRRHATWSCSVCYAVMHLACVKTWAKKSLAASASASASTAAMAEDWRCPGCNSAVSGVPHEYRCFCGKCVNPSVSDRFITPHACDGLCGRMRQASSCPHPCTEMCHPGPCPPCAATITAQCWCTKDEFVVRCADDGAHPNRGRSCDAACGKSLSCGQHSCAKVCHDGVCPPCGIIQHQICYCAHAVERDVACGQGRDQLTHTADDREVRTGSFSCGSVCAEAYDCGVHSCSKPCHPVEKLPEACPMAPNRVHRCPCGKASIDSLRSSPRRSCVDPVPLCSGVCDKPLACGHYCTLRCHAGPCPDCIATVRVPCRCSAVVKDLPCHSDSASSVLTCGRPCERKLACGRHRCTTKCCPARTFISPPGLHPAQLEAITPVEHKCPRTCGKKLRCGVHTCPIECHPGHCPPCLLSSFDELACPCGRTRLFPPIACNAKLPKCAHPCQVLQGQSTPCGHVLTPHTCHPVDEPCPPCVLLVTKTCRCRKNQVPHIPCHRQAPSCGDVCGEILPCGGHKCRRVCHDGECRVDGALCREVCGKPRTDCGHPCADACHAPAVCDMAKPCPREVDVQCPCGRRLVRGRCDSTAAAPKVLACRLVCDDMCDKIQQLKGLAQALDINRDPETLASAQVYEQHLIEMTRLNPAWARRIEEQLVEFVVGSRATQTLPSMRAPQRHFVHALAEAYGIVTESQDPEPHRSVVLYKRPGTAIPAVSLIKFSGMPASRVIEQAREATIHEASKVRLSPNALRLSKLAHGTLDGDIRPHLSIALAFSYALKWLPDGTTVVVIPTSSQWITAGEMFDRVLLCLQVVRDQFQKAGMSVRVEPCHIDAQGELHVLAEATACDVTKTPGPRPAVAQTVAISQIPVVTKNPFSALSQSPPAAVGVTGMIAVHKALEGGALVDGTAGNSGVDLDSGVVDDWMELADEEDVLV